MTIYELSKGFPRGLKSGQHVTLDPYGGDSYFGHSTNTVFIEYKRKAKSMVVLIGEEVEEFSIDSYSLIRVDKEKTPVAHFQRSDDYHFVIFKRRGKPGAWQLNAGCHDLEDSTLAKLERECHEMWEDDHATEGLTPAERARRVSLNRETRRKVSAAIASLRPAKKPAKTKRRKKR